MNYKEKLDVEIAKTQFWIMAVQVGFLIGVITTQSRK